MKLKGCDFVELKHLTQKDNDTNKKEKDISINKKDKSYINLDILYKLEG
jgi:hypothetical protein